MSVVIIEKEGPILNQNQEPLLFDGMEQAQAYAAENLPAGDYKYLESCGSCVRCGAPLFPATNPTYELQCFTCNEDFFLFEQPYNTLHPAYTLQWLYDTLGDLVRRGYGDKLVVFRDEDTEPDPNIREVYVDDEADRVVLRGF